MKSWCGKLSIPLVCTFLWTLFTRYHFPGYFYDLATNRLQETIFTREKLKIICFKLNLYGKLIARTKKLLTFERSPFSGQHILTSESFISAGLKWPLAKRPCSSKRAILQFFSSTSVMRTLSRPALWITWQRKVLKEQSPDILRRFLDIQNLVVLKWKETSLMRSS